MIFGGILGLAVVVFWIWCIFDVIATDESLVRNMPKLMWLLVVIILPTVGAVAWLVLGRPERAPMRPGGRNGGASAPRARPPRPIGPEDSPRFMSELDGRTERLRRWEEDLRKREEDLRRREEGSEEEP